ncbi:hypothetical protein J6590_104838 [Homalodisca vitripennis]|nr:hypothetical protein J6590_104838 [Homalodisca vitripennis]
MTDGSLSFIVNRKWLGTALSGMAGHCLYPIVSSRQGNFRIWYWLRWALWTWGLPKVFTSLTPGNRVAHRDLPPTVHYILLMP